jgi:hypothetical protein
MENIKKWLVVPLIGLALILTLGACSISSSKKEKEESSSIAKADPEKPYAQIIDIMDNNRQVIEEQFLDEAGNLVANEDGYAVMKKTYDENGKVTSTSYYGTDEKAFFVERLG